ncbi:MAG TPA: RNA 2',3'-cyclic phosphodiesterase [Phycisphaerae bacterium]|nr:RNA 2',3'-cyclic phosphodiesterase [Phycisphaerae bacterium]
MRLFIAIDIPSDIADKIAAIQRILADTKADIAWVSPANYHITIKFLGELDDALLPEITARMNRAAAEVPAFPLEAEGIDKLPEKGPTRVIISRILSPDQRLTKLHRLLDSAIGGMGLPMDTRVLVPHLTLGRVRSNHGINRLLRLLEKHDLDFFGSFPAEEVTLYRSLLGDGPAQYEPLHRAPLKPVEKHTENSEGTEITTKQ